jgi:hypothetical protein
MGVVSLTQGIMCLDRRTSLQPVNLPCPGCHLDFRTLPCLFSETATVTHILVTFKLVLVISVLKPTTCVMRFRENVGRVFHFVDMGFIFQTQVTYCILSRFGKSCPRCDHAGQKPWTRHAVDRGYGGPSQCQGLSV